MKTRIKLHKVSENEYNVIKQYISNDLLYPIYWEDNLEVGTEQDCMFYIDFMFPNLKHYEYT